MFGFAPDLHGMTGGRDARWGHNTELWRRTGRLFCGLQAWVYNPATRKNVTMYLMDAFDPKWVRSPDSIDITLAGFAALTNGRWPTDKNVVIRNLRWGFTRKRETRYAFEASKQQSTIAAMLRENSALFNYFNPLIFLFNLYWIL